ncbi:MAG: electron transfer flavoprotein subunit beta/FixA family protein [Clostridiales Family XIII bacterium]|jgi:electron transfer flavoprotein beta subunit|nr:electron transfer flavoprotein subunit beta/FixA family protein [Clostridiales Family XIII bacterium]
MPGEAKLRVLVCVKPVPDPERYELLGIDPATGRLIREGVPTVINPADKNALETALGIKDGLGASVTVIGMAPDFTRERIRECLAMGADEAYLLSDPAFGGADTYATSYALAKGVEKLGFTPDLILAGSASADGATAHVPVQLAEWLKLPHVSNVSSVELEMPSEREGIDARMHAIVLKKAERRHIRYRVRLPAVISVERNANSPRIVPAIGVVKSRSKKLEIWGREDLGIPASAVGYEASPTKSGRLFMPDLRRNGTRVEGSPEEVAAAFAEILRKKL